MLQSYQSVRLPTKLVSELKAESDAAMRSTPKQIEFLIQLARAARDNPDLPIDFIEGCLLAKNEKSVLFEFKGKIE
jgi:hypothetical protein